MFPLTARSLQARRHRRRLAVHSLAAVAAVAMAGGAAAQQGAAIRVADRCSLYGAGFVDIGDGTCARVVRQYDEPGGEHVRVDLGRNAAGATSHAALRSDAPGMLPGAAEAGHLRVPGALYAPR